MHNPGRPWRQASLLVLLLSLLGLGTGCGSGGASDGDATFALTVSPAQLELAAGDVATLTAALTVDGVAIDGARYEWRVAPGGLVTLDGGGGPTQTVTATTAGTAVVTVSAGGETTEVVVQVTGDPPPVLVGLQVDPPSLTLPLGTAGAITATALYSDGDAVDVTDDVVWASSDGSVATVAAGDVTPLAAGAATLTATLVDFSDSCDLTVSAAQLVQIAIAPGAATLPLGTSTTLVATGTYDDASVVDLSELVTWTSSDESVATVVVGKVTAVAVGGATITAALGAVAGEAEVTVTDATLTSVEVTPPSPTAPVGRDVAFAATGLYSDATVVDITDAVTWTSAVTAVASIDAAGVATCHLPGSTEIAAEAADGTRDTAILTCTAAELEALVIAPATLTLAAGRTSQLSVEGTYSDGQHVDLTGVVLWTSSDDGVAQVSNAGTPGELSALAPGAVNITASLGGVADVAEVTVTDAVLVALTIAPDTASAPIGLGQAFTVVGTYSDGSSPDLTTQVTWASSDVGIASISNAAGSEGQTLGLALGVVTVTATLDGITDDASLTVTDATLQSIALTPSSATLPVGATLGFTAEGLFSGGAHLDVSTTAVWAVTPAGVADVSNAAGSEGLVTAQAVGTVTVTATQAGVVGQATVTVTPQPPALLAMRPTAGATGVRPTTAVAFRFSEAMAAATLTAQTSDGACSGSLQLSADDFATCVGFTTAAPAASAGDTTFTLTPAAPLAILGQYRLRATTAAQSAAAVALATDVAQATPFRVRTDGPCADGLVISQIFGAGGNAGAAYDADYVELHNPTAASIALGGTAIQYAPATSATWFARALPSVAIPAGGYYLIRMSSIGAEGAPLSADHVVAPTIAMSGSSAKVALTPTTATLAGLCPIDDVIDLVGYGAMASCADGDLATGSLDVSTAALRRGDGCADSGVDVDDFELAAPAPRGLGTPALVCACSANETDAVAELAYCNLQFPSTLTVAAGELSDLVYGRIYQAGVTEPAGASSRLTMALGYGALGSDPRSGGWAWTSAAYNVQVGNDDEYQARILAPGAGTYAYATRATRDGVNWTYCDLDGAGANPALDFATTQLGAMTVN